MPIIEIVIWGVLILLGDISIKFLRTYRNTFFYLVHKNQIVNHNFLKLQCGWKQKNIALLIKTMITL